MSDDGTAMENNGDHGGGGGESEAPPSKVKTTATITKKAADFFPDRGAHVTDALRAILAELDASEPRLVYEKRMSSSDRSKNHNRLLMSCKCGMNKATFASIFTETETALVHEPEPEPEPEEDDEDAGDGEDVGKGKKMNGGEQEQKQKQKQKSTVVRGLDVQAYDCGGRAYRMNLKYLSSNTGYRIIGPDWTVFLEKNGLLLAAGVAARKRAAGGRRRRRKKKKRRNNSYLPPDDEEEDDDEQQPAAVRHAAAAAGDVQMELWAFRSPKLTVGETGQLPDGALGLLLLHYDVDVVGGGAAAEVQVAAAASQDQRSQEGMVAVVAPGVCGVDDASAAGAAAAPAPPRPEMRLSPLEVLIAVWLSFLSNDVAHNRHTDADRNSEAADANNGNCTGKEGPK